LIKHTVKEYESGRIDPEAVPNTRRLRAIGHLFEAEDESQEWPDLHNAIRHARKAYQADGIMLDWDNLATRANDQRIALATGGGAERGND